VEARIFIPLLWSQELPSVHRFMAAQGLSSYHGAQSAPLWSTLVFLAPFSSDSRDSQDSREDSPSRLQDVGTPLPISRFSIATGVVKACSRFLWTIDSRSETSWPPPQPRCLLFSEPELLEACPRALLSIPRTSFEPPRANRLACRDFL